MAFIPKHSLSIGYNNRGQEFFDLLKKYEEWIHSFYFSFDYMVDEPLQNVNAYKRIFSAVNSYKIPGNVLINEFSIDDKWRSIIEDALTYDINLNGVTVISAKTAELVRKHYPDLEIHLSVRVCEHLIPQGYNVLSMFDGLVDVINMSAAWQHHDTEFRDQCHNKGIRTKFILDEGCQLRRDENFSMMPGCEIMTCNMEGVLKKYQVNWRICEKACERAIQLYPWMDLTRVRTPKEMIPHLGHDIYKLATRSNKVYNQMIEDEIKYYISDERTTNAGAATKISLTDKNYPIFLEYIECRSKCSTKCYQCRRCEDFYERLTAK